jgi:hypothetical protein
MNDARAPARPPEYLPDPEALRLVLAEVGDATRDALHDLSARPSLEACNRALTQIMGARTAVLRYREAIQREECADGG